MLIKGCFRLGGVGCFLLLFTSFALTAQERAAPPPVFYQPEVPLVTGAPVDLRENELDFSARSQVRSSEQPLDAPSAALFGAGVSNWAEGAENGLTDVSDFSDADYDLIQSERVAKGSYAFHLANPSFNDNWFELDVDIDVLADTQLFFQSRLQYATSYQIAKVQVSHDGGSTWPDTIYSQAGSGDSGEGVYVLRSVNLGASYENQQIRIRFYYDFLSSSAWTNTEVYYGWLIDDIQIGGELQKTEWVIGDPTPDEVLYLEFLNRSRADAMAEAARLAALTDPDVTNAYTYFSVNPSDIISQFQTSINNGYFAASAQPLAFNALLMETATKHSQDMYLNQFQGHDSSSNPIAPFLAGDSLGTRLNRVGYSGGAGENVYSYADSVEHGHASFDVDWGNTVDTGAANYNADFVGQGMQNPAGPRMNIHNASFNEAGIGVVNGSNGSVGAQLVTQDLGIANGVTYITGLVYNDTNEDGFYTVTNHIEHEGYGGVRIDVEGSALYTLSTSSGAYAIPVSEDGSYTVTFSGDGLETFTTSIVIAGGLNTKFDYQPVALSGYALWAYENELVGAANDDDDHDGIVNLIEYAVAGMSASSIDHENFPSLEANPDGSRVFSVSKRSGATDVSYLIQATTDLNEDWKSPSEVSGASITTDDASELTLRLEASVAQIFLRLQITQTP